MREKEYQTQLEEKRQLLLTKQQQQQKLIDEQIQSFTTKG